MSDVLDLKSVKDGMSLSGCIVYLGSYERKPKKDGKSFYIAGNLVNKEDSLSFKVWDAALVEALTQNDLSGRVVKIVGAVSSYMNNLDLKITAIEPVDETQYPKSLFLKSADVDGIFREFSIFIKENLSETGLKGLQFIFQKDNLFARFKEEFAGSKMHDAQVGGLLNHTMKMLKIAKVVYDNEPRMNNIPNYKDMLYLGIIFHDIGKIYEMNLGVYTEYSYVTHRMLGIELLVKYKPVIVQCFDENFYYELISVLQGHHGAEWGDAPNTVLAYLVHLIDMVDSQTTGIFDKIERNEVATKAGNMSVYVDGRYLTV